MAEQKNSGRRRNGGESAWGAAVGERKRASGRPGTAGRRLGCFSLPLNLALRSRLPSFGALILWIQCSPTLETARPLQETLPAPHPLLVGVRDTRTHAQTQYTCVQSSRVHTHAPTHEHGHSVTIVAGRGLRGGAARPLRARSLSPRVNGSGDSTFCACSREVRHSKQRTSRSGLSTAPATWVLEDVSSQSSCASESWGPQLLMPQPFYDLTGLGFLRPNSYTIKCTIHWFLVYSWSNCNQHPCLILEYYHHR